MRRTPAAACWPWWCGSGAGRSARRWPGCAMPGCSTAAGPSRAYLHPSPAPRSKPRDTTGAARRVWDATRPLAGTLAETYLLARGVEHVAGAPSLRFSPALTHPQAPGRFPCLVAGVQDVHGGFLAVHRIYLDRSGAGKANVDPVKASLGSTAGGGGSPGGAGARVLAGGGRNRDNRGGDGAVRPSGGGLPSARAD